jgi:hypothetical protein
MDDLASRLANRVQLTSDGHKAYLEAVEGAFGSAAPLGFKQERPAPGGDLGGASGEPYRGDGERRQLR